MRRCWPVLLLLVVAPADLVQPQPPGRTPAISVTKLVPSDGPVEGFAWDLDLDGDTALVGAPQDDVNGTDSGSAYVFERVDGAWVEQAKLVPSDGEENQAFGKAVALDGDTAVVGAPAWSFFRQAPGEAYVFVRSRGGWTEQAKLEPSRGNAYDRFGISVAVDDDRVVIGANADDEAGSSAGAAYVYRRESRTWFEEAKLLVASGQLFGTDVSLQGDTVLIGSPWEGISSWVGAGYVFVRNGSTWSQQARLVPSEPYDFEEMGYSVSLDGNLALLGAPIDSYKGYGPGYAHVFEKDRGSWEEKQRLQASDGGDRDDFGVDVSLLGRTALVGASGKGAGYLFIRPRNGSWSEVLKLEPPPDVRGFGWSVSLSGNRALVATTTAAFV